MAHYKEEEMITIKNSNGCDIKICPECKDHERGEPMEVHDCKNTYGLLEYEKGKFCAKGQCQCWSKEHGIREDD